MSDPGTPRDHMISHLIHIDPQEAEKRILDALRKTGTHKGNASKVLDASHNTLLIWIKKLGLERKIEALVEQAIEEGWHHGKLGGRPPEEDREPKAKKKTAVKKAAAKKASPPRKEAPKVRVKKAATRGKKRARASA